MATSSARPQNGYNYNTPNRGGLDVTPFGSQSINFENFADNGNRLNNGNGFGVAQSNSGFLAGGGQFNGNANLGQFNGNANLGQFNGNPNGGFNGNINGGFNGNLNGGFSGFNGFNTRPQQTLVQKHIYVHVPPPDPEDDILPQRQLAASGIPQKHYKIIFIKAPSVSAPSQAQVALAAQSQEKTIVYVLVKKPDELGDLSLPAAISAPTSKPEVYFIKYKTQKENRGNGLGVNLGSTGLGGNLGIGGLDATLGSSISVSGSSNGLGINSNVIGLSGSNQGSGSLGSVAPLQGSASSSIGGKFHFSIILYYRRLRLTHFHYPFNEKSRCVHIFQINYFDIVFD